jgi:hypothetical protein
VSPDGAAVFVNPTTLSPDGVTVFVKPTTKALWIKIVGHHTYLMIYESMKANILLCYELSE